MKRKLFYLAMSFFCASILLSAQVKLTINLDEPGKFKEQLGDKAATVTHLTVKGKMNNTDFLVFMSTKSLLELDLSEVVVVDKGGADQKELPDYALMETKTLEKLVLPHAIERIGDHACTRCSALKTVVIPQSVKTIAQSAFMKCVSLTQFELPSELVSIGRNAFYEVPMFKNLVLPKKLQKIGATAFYKTGIETVQINASLSEIGKAAFGNCKNLTSYKIETGNKHFVVENEVLFNSDKTILYAYPQASSKNSYTTPASVKEIKTSAFDSAVRLEELRINEGVEVIPNSMCYGDSALLKIYLPSTIKKIDLGAFDWCKQLKEFHLRATTPPEVVDGAFGVMFKNMKMNLFIPKGTLEAYRKVPAWDESFLSITEEDEGELPEDPYISIKTQKKTGEMMKIVFTPVEQSQQIEIEGAVYDSEKMLYRLEQSTIKLKGPIKYLYVENQQVAEVDLSHAAELTILEIAQNKLSSIDLSGAAKLKSLGIHDNPLMGLDVRNCYYLESLNVANCGLASLDVSQNQKLNYLNCSLNKLTKLDLKGNPELIELLAANNKLTELNTRNNPYLAQLHVSGNAITKMYFKGNPALRVISLFGNQIKDQDMTDMVESLPLKKETDNAALYVVDTKAEPKDLNICLVKDVEIAVKKHWAVLDFLGDGEPVPYKGYDASIVSIEDEILTVIAPNPATDYVNISAVPNCPVELYSVEGVLLASDMCDAEGALCLTVSDYPAGRYVLIVGKKPHKLTIIR